MCDHVTPDIDDRVNADHTKAPIVKNVINTNHS